MRIQKALDKKTAHDTEKDIPLPGFWKRDFLFFQSGKAQKKIDFIIFFLSRHFDTKNLRLGAKTAIFSLSPFPGHPFWNSLGKKRSKKRIEKKAKSSKKPQRNPKEVILATLKKQPSLSIRELAVQCKMSVHSVQHHVNKLKEAGVVRHVGPTKAGRWEVVEGHIDK